jgi:hypothetical protein
VHRALRWLRANRLFLLIAFTCAYFHQGSDPNQTSRLALIQAMVERGAVDITPARSMTLDKGVYAGKAYSDKAPGVALLVAPAYAVMLFVDRRAGRAPDDRGVQRVHLHALSFLAAGLPATLGAWFLFHTLLLFKTSRGWAELLTIGWGLGTLVFPFATLMFGHTLAAALLLAAFYLLQKWRAGSVPVDWRRASVLGLLWGGSIIVEYPTGTLVAIMGLYALSLDRQPRKIAGVLLGSALGSSFPFLLHALFAYAAYGTPFVLPYKYLIEPIFVAHTSAGILGIGVPTKIGIWGALLSPYRGLFFFCPFLALVFAGFSSWFASHDLRREMWCLMALIGAYLVFATSYYAWDGGGSTGSRHLVPVMAFFVIAIAFFARSSRRAGIVTATLIAVSVLIMFLCTAVIVQVPEGGPYEANPFYTVVLPSVLRGTFERNLQDAYYPRLQADVVYNLGTLLGASPRLSLLVPVAAWALAYAGRLLPKRRVHAVA